MVDDSVGWKVAVMVVYLVDKMAVRMVVESVY